ncbi:hypothetical protein B9Z19DRAFT_654024 [Tuber borchii]|uniref:Uncharacterized protein n=1 Tax=Tuber borchii TaxID=42251 RepID=A0A2T7A095_TUBBO|nr:hypothetical protein B9Z19DRAFT_654024 [Tuber borchii]
MDTSGLWRHLKLPRVDGRTGDEKDAWENLHKIELERLLATCSSRRRSARVQTHKRLGIAEFELRARGMGITEEVLVAQKVKIWEGIWVAKKNGEDIEYGALVLLDFIASP